MDGVEGRGRPRDEERETLAVLLTEREREELGLGRIGRATGSSLAGRVKPQFENYGQGSALFKGLKSAPNPITSLSTPNLHIIS